MATIPKQKSTIDIIDQVIEDSQESSFRAHLGGSLIGDSCKRKLWFDFRWCTVVVFPGRVLRLFNTGKRYEDRFIEWLRLAGVTAYQVDEQGKQFKYELFNGHFGGELDAVLTGLLEAPGTPHVAEFKTHNNKSFTALKKDGVAKAQPRHYAQMQIYMEMSGLTRAYYLAVNKDNDELYSERIRIDKAITKELKNKAQEVIFAPEPLTGISTRPDWYECKFCQHQNICHYGDLPEVNCRTCMNVTTTECGSWHCEAHDKHLTRDEQIAGCGSHLFIPKLMPWAEIIDYDKTSNRPEWVTYKNLENNVEFTNCVESLSRALHDNNFSSVELARLNKHLIGDPIVTEISNTFK